MAHVENYTLNDIKHILEEHDRKLEKYKNYVDENRSHLNFNYEDAENFDDMVYKCTNAVEQLDEANGNSLIRSNTKPISEWVVTYPARYCYQVPYEAIETDEDGNEVKVTRHYNKPKDEKHCKQFFDEVNKFTKQRYNGFEFDGETYDRYLGMYVNMDETTPHGHIVSLALAKSKNSGKLTLSASSFMPKKELIAYQKEMEQHMCEFFKVDEFGLMDKEKQEQPELTEEENLDYTHTKGKVSTENFKLQRKLEDLIANQEVLIDDKANDKADEIMGLKMRKYIKELKPDTTDDDLQDKTTDELAETLKILYNEMLDLQNELDDREAEQEEKEKDFQGKEDRLEALQRSTEKEKQKLLADRKKLTENADKLREGYMAMKLDKKWYNETERKHAEAIKERQAGVENLIHETGFDRQFNE